MDDSALRITVTNSVNLGIWKAFKKFCKDNNVPASRLLDEAMVDMLKKKGAEIDAGN